MKKFHFSLQRVLNVKKVYEKEKQRVMSEALQKLNSEKLVLEGMVLEEQVAIQKIMEMKKQNVTPAILALLHRSLEGQYVKKKRQENAVMMAENDVEMARFKLIEAQKEKKVFERLEEKKAQEYFEQLQQLEQKELDEIALLQQSRKL